MATAGGTLKSETGPLGELSQNDIVFTDGSQPSNVNFGSNLHTLIVSNKTRSGRFRRRAVSNLRVVYITFELR